MSFDNINKTNIKKSSLVFLIFLAFLTLVLSVFIPFFSPIGLALLPVPVIFLVLSGRLRDGVICAIASCAALSFLNYIAAIVLILLVISIAFMYRKALEKDAGIFFIVRNVFLLFFASILLYAVVSILINGPDYFGNLVKNYNNYINNLERDPLISMYTGAMQIEESQLSSIIEQTKNILRFIPFLIPGFIVVYLAVISVINYFGSFIVLKKININLREFLPMKYWDIPWYYCWGMILGLILILIPDIGIRFDRAIDITGYNLLIIFGFTYFILGISVIWGLFERFKLSILIRGLIIFMIGVFLGFAFLLLPFLGLIDIWANFRKLNRKGN